MASNLFTLIIFNAVPFVDGDDERPPALERHTEHARILLRDCIVRIKNQDDDVRILDRL